MKPVLLTLPFLILGCASSEPAPAPVARPEAKALTAKLKAMTPEERKVYLKQHPEEAMAAIGGPGVPKR